MPVVGQAMQRRTDAPVLGKALVVWLFLIAAEVVHGTLRTIFLAPAIGDFRARQVSVFSGSLIILLLACVCARWLGARTTASQIAIGGLWLTLTLAFEVAVGRLAFGLSWERLASDYNLLRGGLLPIGLAVLSCAPAIASRLRHVS